MAVVKLLWVRSTIIDKSFGQGRQEMSTTCLWVRSTKPTGETAEEMSTDYSLGETTAIWHLSGSIEFSALTIPIVYRHLFCRRMAIWHHQILCAGNLAPILPACGYLLW